MSQNEQVIRLLEDRDHVRLRPGMYIPNINYSVYELVDNAVDQYMLGNGDTINVIIDSDGSIMVQDFGAGLPIAPSQDIPEMSQAELALSRLKAGGKFEDNGVKSAGLNGVGSSAINFLSEYFYVRISKQGRLYGLDFEQGLVVNQLYEMEDENDEYPDNGTLIMLRPDDEIWQDIGNTLDIPAINRRLKQLAYLNPGLTINFQVEDYNGHNIEEAYLFEEGVKSYVEELTENKDLILDPIYVTKEVDDIEVSIALAYTEAIDHVILAFTNNVPNTDGKSSHLAGLKAGLADAVKDYQVETTNKLKNPITAEDTREGIVAVVSVKVASPNYIGQGKDYLNMPSVRKATADTIKECMEDYIDKNPNNAKLILEKALEAQRVRETVRKAKETARKTKGLVVTTKPEKLVKCVSKSPEESVIWLVEGDSAAGSAKQARNEQIDAIFPAFGKINNTYDYTLDKILTSSKILDVIKILECGIGEDFDIEKLRYHKIIIMTDADVDGAHIRTLLLTFFYRFMRPLIEAGYVYIAQPPLYKISQNKRVEYVYSDEELKEKLAHFSGKPNLQRYKGLGEMNADQLWDTTMDPKYRTLLKVNLDDVIEADRIFSTLMGDDVEPRREFIEQNATYANIDA